MVQLNQGMWVVGRLLLDAEACTNGAADPHMPAAGRVCEKLRLRISSLAGEVGFHSLIARALTLARAKCPKLNTVQIKLDGSVECLGEMPTDDIAEGASVLIVELLDLLSKLVGETMTIRLLQEAWPNLPDLNKIPSREDYDARR